MCVCGGGLSSNKLSLCGIRMTREETPLVQRQEDQLGCSSRGRLRALQMIGSLEPSEKTGTFFLADPLQRVVLCVCVCVM